MLRLLNFKLWWYTWITCVWMSMSHTLAVYTLNRSIHSESRAFFITFISVFEETCLPKIWTSDRKVPCWSSRSKRLRGKTRKTIQHSLTNEGMGNLYWVLNQKGQFSSTGATKKPDGTYSTSSKETIEVLMSAQFPGALCTLPKYRPHRPRNEDWSRTASIIRPE